MRDVPFWMTVMALVVTLVALIALLTAAGCHW